MEAENREKVLQLLPPPATFPRPRRRYTHTLSHSHKLSFCCTLVVTVVVVDECRRRDAAAAAVYSFLSVLDDDGVKERQAKEREKRRY